MGWIVKTSEGKQIKLEDKPFHSGGEGELFKIESPLILQDHCVKIYLPQYQSVVKEQKLKFMMQHKPAQTGDGANYMICWVTEIVYRQGAFVGYLMPLAVDGSIQLYELCTTKIRKTIGSIWHQKFDRTSDSSIQNRLKLCVNISIAIANIHKTSNYVLVDMKPQNILVSPTGEISLVDLDSIQIARNDTVIHTAHVATPEYVPPEGRKLDPKVDYISETWDRFSIAVIFYELLLGLHPFVATGIGPYQNITTIDEAISNGLFVFGAHSKYLQLPPIHNYFNKLPGNIQRCFVNAFVVVAKNHNSRPTASEWGQTFYNELKSVIKAYISCPACGELCSVPQDKHIKFNCPKCDAKIESKNGMTVGYVAEKVTEKIVYRDREKIVYRDREKKVIETEVVLKENASISWLVYLVAIASILLNFYFKDQLSTAENSLVKNKQEISDLNQRLSNLNLLKNNLSKENYELKDRNIKLNQENDDLGESIIMSPPSYFQVAATALSFAQIFGDLGLQNPIYKVPPSVTVYVISEITDQTVYVYCDGKFGFMERVMLYY